MRPGSARLFRGPSPGQRTKNRAGSPVPRPLLCRPHFGLLVAHRNPQTQAVVEEALAPLATKLNRRVAGGGGVP